MVTRRTVRAAVAAAVAVLLTTPRVTATVATVGALTALACVAAIRVLPGLVDVGFLGSVATPIPVRLALHLPLSLALLATALDALLVAGALRHWWTRRVRPRDAALAVPLTALTVLLTSWHLVLLTAAGA